MSGNGHNNADSSNAVVRFYISAAHGQRLVRASTGDVATTYTHFYYDATDSRYETQVKDGILKTEYRQANCDLLCDCRICECDVVDALSQTAVARAVVGCACNPWKPCAADVCQKDSVTPIRVVFSVERTFQDASHRYTLQQQWSAATRTLVEYAVNVETPICALSICATDKDTKRVVKHEVAQLCAYLSRATQCVLELKCWRDICTRLDTTSFDAFEPANRVVKGSHVEQSKQQPSRVRRPGANAQDGASNCVV